MDIQLEKDRLIAQIQQVTDADLLKALKSLLDYSVKKQTVPNVPDWHKDVVRKRLDKAQAHPEKLLSWDDVMQELES